MVMRQNGSWQGSGPNPRRKPGNLEGAEAKAVRGRVRAMSQEKTSMLTDASKSYSIPPPPLPSSPLREVTPSCSLQRGVTLRTLSTRGWWGWGIWLKGSLPRGWSSISHLAWLGKPNPNRGSGNQANQTCSLEFNHSQQASVRAVRPGMILNRSSIRIYLQYVQIYLYQKMQCLQLCLSILLWFLPPLGVAFGAAPSFTENTSGHTLLSLNAVLHFCAAT